MADTLLSLDIHKDAVAAVLIDRSAKKNLVIGCSTVEMTEQNFAAAIDRIKEQTGFVAGDSIVTFGAELFSFRNLTLPFTDRRKIEQVLPFELEDRLPIEMRSMVVDFAVVKEEPAGADLLAALVNRQYLADKLAVLGARGINPDAVDISGLATGMKIADEGGPDRFVVLDVGTGWATVFIFINRKIALIRSLPVPAGLRGQDGQAEKFLLGIKQTLLASRLVDIGKADFPLYLIGVPWPDPAVVAQSLTGVEIRKFELHARRSVKFHDDVRSRYQPEIMERVLAAAGTSEQKGRSFNFRKDEFKKRRTPQEYRRLLVKIAVPLSVTFLAVVGYLTYDYQSQLAQQEQLRSQINEVFRETVPDVATIVNPIQQLQAINNQIKATYKPGGKDRSGFTVIDLLAELSSRIPASFRVKVVRLVADADTVRMKAITSDFNTVDNIQKELGKSPYFTEVVISSANQSTKGDEINFELKLDLAKQ